MHMHCRSSVSLVVGHSTAAPLRRPRDLVTEACSHEASSPCLRLQLGGAGAAEALPEEEAPVPADRPATTLETVSARARRDVRQMGGSGTGGLLGVAADLKEAPMTLRPLSRVTPETTDEEFAAAVRRGLEDLRGFDKIEDSRPGEMPPGAVEKK